MKNLMSIKRTFNFAQIMCFIFPSISDDNLKRFQVKTIHKSTLNSCLISCTTQKFAMLWQLKWNNVDDDVNSTDSMSVE